MQLVLVDILLLLSDYHLSCPKNCHVRVLYTTRFAVITRVNIMSINCVPLGVLWMSWRQRSAFSTVVLIKRCVGLIAASTWFSPCEASIADHPCFHMMVKIPEVSALQLDRHLEKTIGVSKRFQTAEFFLGFARLPSRSLTCPLKSYLPNRKVVFQPSFFRGYVKLPGGNSLQSPIVAGYRVPGIHVSLKLPRSGCQ